MKPQEVWSHTYRHLWQSANTMLATTPTVSRHLARTLVSSIPEDEISALATRQHCHKCSALMINAKVRLRKLNKRPRRADKAVKNLVLRTCSMCGTTNAERGAERVAVSKTCVEEIAELRKKMEEQRERTDFSKGEDKGDGKQEQRKNKGSRAVVHGRIKKKKKKKKGRSQGNSSNGQGATPRTGLAASFLFDPIP